MKLLPTLLTFLILASLGYSIEYTEVFDEELENNKEFTVDNGTWHIQAFDVERARIRFPDGQTTLIHIGDTAESGNYLVFLSNIKSGEFINFSYSDIDKYFDAETQTYKLLPNIIISKKEADILLTREFEKTTFLKGETVKVTVTILNEGSLNIVDAQYLDIFPEEIVIVDVLDCSKEGNSIKWNGNIGIGKEKTFSYTIKAKAPTKFTSIAELSYNSDTESNSQEIEVLDPQLTIETTLPKSFPLGEETNIAISFTNNNTDHDINLLKYSIYLPVGLKKISSIGHFDRISNYWVYSEPLESSANRTVSLIVRAEKLGKFQIKEETDYTINDISDKLSSIHDIEVSTEELVIDIGARKLYQPGQSIIIPIKIVNPNTKQAFKNLKLDIESNLPNIDKGAVINEIKPKETLNVFELSLDVPSENKEYYIKAKLTYDTVYAETLRKSENVTIKISSGTEKPQEQVVNVENPDEKPAPASTNTTGEGETTKDEFLNDSGKKIIIFSAIALLAIALIVLVIFKIKHEKTIEDKLKKIEE